MIQEVLSEGVQLWWVFFGWWVEGGSKYHYKRVTMGPQANRHLNGVSLACRWRPNIDCWRGSFVVFQGIWTSIAKKLCIFVIFQGGSNPLSLTPPPLWIRPWIELRHDFQQCGILTCVDSVEPVQPLLKLRTLKWYSVNSLTIIE